MLSLYLLFINKAKLPSPLKFAIDPGENHYCTGDAGAKNRNVQPGRRIPKKRHKPESVLQREQSFKIDFSVLAEKIL